MTGFLITGSVYPRWRGEHRILSLLMALNIGLSPLARGTHQLTLLLSGQNRFIPAGAGNTTKGDTSGGKKSVYPRWRGEHPI